MDNELMLGHYGLPLVLSIILGLVYKIMPMIGDRWKSLVSAGVGSLLGLAALFYSNYPWTPANLIDYALYGLMAGTSATGIYELQRTVTKPRG